MKYSNSYIVRIQFLGFRFHGWQKQPDVKTVHDIVDKTLSYALEHFNFSTMGVGRTDSKVSAKNYPFQLFINEKIDLNSFVEKFNINAPNDLNCLSIEKCDIKFSIINSNKIKEYHYYFAFGEKQDPFSAPILVSFKENLDIELMKKGAKLFEGTHHFHKYCSKPKEKTVLIRTINNCEIVENIELKANFFPKKSYVLKVKGKGFLRHQIRFMMAVLYELGKGNFDLKYIENSISENNDKKHFPFIAPSSGLMLFDVKFL